MAHYAVSDVKALLAERDWESFDQMIKWLEHQPADAQAGLSAADRQDLIRDLTRARDGGVELTDKAGELYRAIVQPD
jgi:hypothetical protein